MDAVIKLKIFQKSPSIDQITWEMISTDCLQTGETPGLEPIQYEMRGVWIIYLFIFKINK